MAALDFSRDMDRLRGEMDEIRKHMSRLSRSARHSGTGWGREALDGADELHGRARKQLTRAEKQVEQSVGNRPIVSLLIAVGIGFLIAKLFNWER